MNNICPLHQFEIRFTPILNFAAISKEIIGPYIQRTSTFQLENENTINEKLNLNFENDSYSIILWWDRLILRTTVGVNDLDKSNSIAQEPFFSIFDKLKSNTSFGKVNNTLFFTLSVNVKELKDVQESLNEITSRYLQSDVVEKILPEFNDTAVVLEKRNSKQEKTITFGPYQGINDFKKRNIEITQQNIKLLSGIVGTMIEYKVVSYETTSIDFKFYKDSLIAFNSTLEKI